MVSRIHNRKGFTLIELMIVVVIIGILAALAIPRFMQATTKSKQSEAKQILKQVYTMQRAYRQEYGSYGDNGEAYSGAAPGTFGDIGVEVQSSAIYTYTMTAGVDAFSCVATANLDDDGTIDTWTITDAGVLDNDPNDVTG